MLIKLLALTIAMLAVMPPVWAQVPEALREELKDQQPTWENAQKNPGVTRLGWDLGSIAAKRAPAPPPTELGLLIAQGLADRATYSREMALNVIASLSGVLHAPTPENFAMWTSYRDTLLGFRKPVEALLYDQDRLIRGSAMMAFGALSMRPGKGVWVMMDFDDDALRTLTELYYQEPTSRSGGRPHVRGVSVS